MDRTTLDIVKDALLKQPEILAAEFERVAKLQREVFNESIKTTTLTDKKLIRILEEQANSEGQYKEKIDKLLKDYIQEKNIQGGQLEELNSLLERTAKIQEMQIGAEIENRKREQRENPLTAFKHAWEDLKNSNEKKGYYDIKSSTKTLGKGLLEGFNLKTISKGLLHGAGVLFNNPALNILADKISTSVQKQEKQNIRQFEFLQELEDIDNEEAVNKKLKKTKAEKDFEDDAEKTKEVITEIKAVTSDGLNETNIKPVIEKLNSIEGNTENTYIDLGSILENIKDELEKQTSIYKEQLFIAKDSANDVKQESSLITYNRGAVATKPNDDEEKEGGFGLLGDIASDFFDGKGKGKGKRKRKGKGKGISNAVKGLGSIAMGIGRIAGPIALVTGAVVSVYEGIKGYQNAAETFNLDEGQIATTSQKLTSGISSIIDTLTFGLFDEKAVAQKIDDMNSYVTTGIKKIFGQYNNSEKITDELEAKGVIDKSVIGNSEVRDWSAIEKLSLPQLQSLYDFGDWDKETEEKLRSLIRQSKNGKEILSINTPPSKYSSPDYKPPVPTTDFQIKMTNLNKEAISAGVSKMSKEDADKWYLERGYNRNTGKFINSDSNTKITSVNNLDNNPANDLTKIKSVEKNTTDNITSIPNVIDEKIPESKNENQIIQPNVVVQSPPPTVINNGGNERKIDNLNLTDKDNMILVSTLGIGR